MPKSYPLTRQNLSRHDKRAERCGETELARLALKYDFPSLLPRAYKSPMKSISSALSTPERPHREGIGRHKTGPTLLPSDQLSPRSSEYLLISLEGYFSTLSRDLDTFKSPQQTTPYSEQLSPPSMHSLLQSSEKNAQMTPSPTTSKQYTYYSSLETPRNDDEEDLERLAMELFKQSKTQLTSENRPLTMTERKKDPTSHKKQSQNTVSSSRVNPLFRKRNDLIHHTEELNRRVIRLETENATLRTTQTPFTPKSNSQLEAYQELSEKRRKLEKEIERLQKDLHAVKVENHSLLTEMETVVNTCESLLEEKAELERKLLSHDQKHLLSENIRLESSVTSLQQQIVEESQENSVLLNETAELRRREQGIMAQLSDRVTAMNLLQTQLNQALQDKERALAEKREAEACILDLKQKVEEQYQQISPTIDTEQAGTDAERKRLENEIIRMQQGNERLLRELAEQKRRERDILTQSVDAANGVSDRPQIADMPDILHQAQMKKSLNDLEKENERLLSEIRENSSEKQSLLDQIENGKHEIENQQNIHKIALDKEIDAHNALKNQIEQLLTTLESIQQENSELKQIQDNNHKLEQQNEINRQNEEEETMKELRAMRKQVQEMEEESYRMRLLLEKEIEDKERLREERKNEERRKEEDRASEEAQRKVEKEQLQKEEELRKKKEIEAKQEIENLQQKVADLLNEIETMREEKQAQHDSNLHKDKDDTIRNREEELSQQNNELTTRLELQQRSNDALQDEVNRAVDLENSLNKQNSELKAQIEGLERLIREFETKEEQRREEDETKTKMEDGETKTKMEEEKRREQDLSLKQNENQEKEEMEQQMKEESKEREDEIERLSRLVESLQSELEREKDKQQITNDEMEREREEMCETKEEIKKREEEMTRMEQLLKQTMDNLKEEDEKRKQTEDLHQQRTQEELSIRDRQVNEKDSLLKERDSLLKEKEATIEQLEDELRSSQTANSEKENSLRQSEEQIRAREHEISQREDEARKQISDLTTQLETLKTNNHDLLEEVKNYSDIHASLKTQIGDQETQIEGLQKNNQDLQHNFDMLTAEHASISTKNENLVEQLASQNNANIELKLKIEELQKGKGIFETRIGELEGSINNLREDLQNETRKAETLSYELDTQRLRHTAQLENQRAETDTLREEARKSDEIRRDLNSQISDLASQLEAQKRDNTDLRTEIEKASTTQNDLITQINDLTKQLEIQKRTNEGFLQTQSEIETENRNNVEQITKLEETLDKQRQEFEDKQTELQKSMEDIQDRHDEEKTAREEQIRQLQDDLVKIQAALDRARQAVDEERERATEELKKKDEERWKMEEKMKATIERLEKTLATKTAEREELVKEEREKRGVLEEQMRKLSSERSTNQTPSVISIQFASFLKSFIASIQAQSDHPFSVLFEQSATHNSSKTPSHKLQSIHRLLRQDMVQFSSQMGSGEHDLQGTAFTPEQIDTAVYTTLLLVVYSVAIDLIGSVQTVSQSALSRTSSLASLSQSQSHSSEKAPQTDPANQTRLIRANTMSTTSLPKPLSRVSSTRAISGRPSIPLLVSGLEEFIQSDNHALNTQLKNLITLLRFAQSAFETLRSIVNDVG
ncbi:hypothetical protein BLNAU_929 [Blattamonas nauphoetae]|uniref:Uncharacterized protein n=1 Tax=Blattamonas nauphoetae TaxID=2049346 RepID=A0ABQ9YJC8_9EUKA|nr:hypothetical protein BLNAU_929 [Blattamonas nauphoetae]